MSRRVLLLIDLWGLHFSRGKPLSPSGPRRRVANQRLQEFHTGERVGVTESGNLPFGLRW